jgi:hypothetical protein
MALNFLQPYLDSRITFSRGTNATLVDSTGNITYAPANLVQRSEEFTNAYWVKLDVTATADVTTAPNGTATADKFVATNTASTRRLLYANATLSAGLSIFSFYAKAAEYSLVRTVDSAGGSRWFASFDLTSGTVVGGTTGGAQFVSASISAVGDGWYRCWVVFNAAAGAGAIGMVGYPAGATLDQFGVLYAGNGVSGTFFWGAQLEQVTYQTTPGTYNPTTSAAYYGPRFDYDPVTLAPRGLLIEEARTNSVIRSAEFENAAWLKNNVNVTANSAVSPDGTSTADLMVSAVGTAITGASSSGFTFTAAAHTQSVYVKAATNVRYIQLLWTSGGISTNYANFDLQTGTVTAGTYTSATMTNEGNGWYRIALTSTTGAATGGMWPIAVPSASSLRAATYVGNGTDSFLIWGAQLEVGAFATSYIPTVASTVTRNADIAQMTGANFSSWYNQTEGTFVSQYDSYLVDTSSRNALSAYASGTPTNNILLFNTVQRQFQVNNAGNQADLDGGTPASNVVTKAAGAYKVNDFALSLNGGGVVTDTLGSVPTVDTLGIGISSISLTPINGHVRTVAYYNTRLPDTQLQVLST